MAFMSRGTAVSWSDAIAMDSLSRPALVYR